MLGVLDVNFLLNLIGAVQLHQSFQDAHPEIFMLPFSFSFLSVTFVKVKGSGFHL